MNNFLIRLAARTLGTAPLAQPVVPPIFAPAESGSQVDFPRSPLNAAEASATPLQFSAPQTRITSPAAVQPPHEPHAQPQPVTKSATSDHPQTTVQPAIVELNSDFADPHSLLPRLSPLRDTEQPVSFFEEPGSAEHLKEPITELSRALLSPTKRVAVTARQRSDPLLPVPLIAGLTAVPPGHHSLTDSGPQQPMIKVTIGRVDVRAEFPSASAPSAATRRQSGGMSLEEYARQRSEGKR